MDSRSELYRAVDTIRAEMGMRGSDGFYHMVANAYGAYHTVVRGVDFSCSSLCGMSQLGEPDVILINRNKPETVKRFALAHELVHTRLHRENPCAFMLDHPLANVDPALEREANEGAAELLLPWREFLPLMLPYRNMLGGNNYYSLCRKVCPARLVSRSVVRIRAQQLWHPFEVYCRTRSLDAAEQALDDVPTGYAYGLNFERIPLYQ